MAANRSISICKTLLRISLVFAISTPFITHPISAQADSILELSPSRSIALSSERIDRSGCLESYLSGYSIDVPNLIDTSFGCYELRLNGAFAGLQKGWSLQQAIANLEQQKIANPQAQIEGYFGGFEIGYELYWDGVRVGYEPGWTLEQASANLEWNQATYPDHQIEGYFYGFKVGYELYWDGVRVGYEPGWTYEQALENLQWNQQTYPDKVVQGSYNGSTLR